MFIDINEISNDIEVLSNMLANTSDVKVYKYISCNIDLLVEIYKTISGKDYSKPIKRNLLLESMTFVEDEKVVDIYKNEYLNDRDYHNRVFRNMFVILSKCVSKPNKFDDDIDFTDYEKIIDSFLESFNKDMFEYYIYLKNNGYIDLFTEKDREENETNNIFMLNKRYILLGSRISIEGAHVIIHEIGHAYSQKLEKDNDASYNDCYSFFEFYSSFMERMFTNYLLSNKLYVKDAKIVNDKYLYQLRLYAKDLMLFREKNNDYIRENIEILASSMIYFYGEYLALIKEYDYYNNKGETIDRINEYLKYQGTISKDEGLEILDVSKLELVTTDKVRKLLKIQ